MLYLGAFYNKMFMFKFLRVTRGMIRQKISLKTLASLHHSFSLIATMDKAVAIILLCALAHSTISLPFGPQERAGPQKRTGPQEARPNERALDRLYNLPQFTFAPLLM